MNGHFPESPYFTCGVGEHDADMARGEGSGSGSSSHLMKDRYQGAYSSGSLPQVQLHFLANPTPASIAALLDASSGPTSQEFAGFVTSPKGKGKAPEVSPSLDDHERLEGVNGSDRTSAGDGASRNARARLVLSQTLRYSLERGDAELVGWLCSLVGERGTILDEAVSELEDEDGWGIVGMAILGSCGRQEKEEGVRAVVGRWGLDFGPRRGRDKGGWTPLHLAALLATPPLISFLLAKGASTHAVTNRGFTPLDLISGMEDREDVMIMLEHTTGQSFGPPLPIENLCSASGPDLDVSESRRAMLQRRRLRATQHRYKAQRAEKKRMLQDEQERWLRERVKCMDVDLELLLPPLDTRRHNRWSDDSGIAWDDNDLDESDQDDLAEDESYITGNDFSNMLVFSPSSLTDILDLFVTNYLPQSQPICRRALPANALFRYARFALQRDTSWLTELVEGVIERIEEGAYGSMENLPFLAFWAYNTTLLLHLLKTDKELSVVCEEYGYLAELEGLINAIQVFVIRVTERRIDTHLDAGLLDYEVLEEVSDVKFEGEWNLFRPLTIRKKRETVPKASSIFLNGSNQENTTPPSASMFGSLRDGSPFRSPARPSSLQDIRASISHDSLATIGGADAETTPSKITDILSAVLVVLQLYEVNPAITVQAFSQIFYWIACELFNRILTRKKYLCRTKAVQIRLNITALDDWVRANGLPAKTATKHLEPVTQLLQWLQCLSQVNEFDTLIGTMQNMKAINPLQMRRAVRDYRYEVNEGRMTEECGQYLAQLQKDWEKQRVQLGSQQMRRTASQESEGPDGDDSIDSLFDESTSLADWSPHAIPECLGELLDSRFMIPFLLPSNTAHLVATPPTGIAFQNMIPLSPRLPGDDTRSTPMSRPISRSSFSTSRPMGYNLPSAGALCRLPDDFYAWLKSREMEKRLKKDSFKVKNLATAVNPPLGPSQKMNIPNTSRATPVRIKTSGLPRSTYEDDMDTPLAQPPTAPALRVEYPFPSPGLSTSPSMDELRAKSKITSPQFQSVPKSHVRTDSYELSVRTPPGSSFRTNAATGRPGGSPSPSPSSARSGYPPSPTASGSFGSREFSKMKVAATKRGEAGSPSTSAPMSPYERGIRAGMISPVVSPDLSEGSRKKSWWNSLTSASSVEDDIAGSRERTRREGSDDTIMQDLGRGSIRSVGGTIRGDRSSGLWA